MSDMLERKPAYSLSRWLEFCRELLEWRDADAARADRAAWAVQRLRAAAATRSATGSASPRPDRTSWLGGLRRAFSPAFRAGSLYPLARGCRRNLARRSKQKQGDC